MEIIESTHYKVGDQTDGLLKVTTDFTYGLDILNQYDHQSLTIESTCSNELFCIIYAEAMKVIQGLRNKFKGRILFGIEKDRSFQESLAAIYQTFDGKALYPSVEEKATSLLYFVVKTQPFIDGNNPIAALLFVWFLEKNGVLFKTDGSKRIADNALVAMVIMIAESSDHEKDIMLKVVVNLINAKN